MNNLFVAKVLDDNVQFLQDKLGDLQWQFKNKDKEVKGLLETANEDVLTAIKRLEGIEKVMSKKSD